MSRNPKFDALLEEMQRLHDQKNHDYAEEANPYSNFEQAAAQALGGNVDGVFHVLIEIKLARLRELFKGKLPNYESIDDSLLDLALYTALWCSYHR